MNQSHSDEGETVPLAGVSVSPVAASPRDCVILFFPAPPAADDRAGEDCWEPVGLAAVRLVGRFQLPFVRCEVQAGDREEEGTPGLR